MVRLALTAGSLPLLALAGCEDALASDRAAWLPPQAEGASGAFELRFDGMDRRDRLFEVEVFGAPRGATIVFAVSPAVDGERACPTDITPICVALAEPATVIEQARVDEDGEAWAYVPWSYAQGTGAVDVQAWTLDDGRTWVSNGLRLTVP